MVEIRFHKILPADHSCQPNSGRHSPAAPFSFFALFRAVGETFRAAFFVFFLICLGGSLPLAILLMILASN